MVKRASFYTAEEAHTYAMAAARNWEVLATVNHRGKEVCSYHTGPTVWLGKEEKRTFYRSHAGVPDKIIDEPAGLDLRIAD